MKRPPRRSDDRIVGWPMLWRGALQGGSLLAATLAIYAVALLAGRAEDVARTLAVVGLTAGNLLLVAVNASAGLGWRSLFSAGARAFWWVTGLAAAALAFALAAPGARSLLRFDVPQAGDLVVALAVVALSVAVGALPVAWRREH